MVELGPQLEALGAAMEAETEQLVAGKRAALLEQQHAALVLLRALWPFGCSPREPPPLLRPAFASLARGTAAMLAASAAVLAAPQQPAECPAEVCGAVIMAAPELLRKVAGIAALCQQVDDLVFKQPVASQELAAHALSDSAGTRWLAAVIAGPTMHGSSDSTSSAADLLVACPVTDLLTMPAAAGLARAVKADSQLQQRLLQLLLPGLMTPLTAAQQDELRPAALSTCIAALVDLTPEPLAAHMATPAGLRSLQAASQQLLQLQQERKEQQRQQRRQQRQAAAAGQQAGGNEQPAAPRADQAHR